jgi:hypothetical protein
MKSNVLFFGAAHRTIYRNTLPQMNLRCSAPYYCFRPSTFYEIPILSVRRQILLPKKNHPGPAPIIMGTFISINRALLRSFFLFLFHNFYHVKPPDPLSWHFEDQVGPYSCRCIGWNCNKCYIFSPITVGYESGTAEFT